MPARTSMRCRRSRGRPAPEPDRSPAELPCARNSKVVGPNCSRGANRAGPRELARDQAAPAWLLSGPRSNRRRCRTSPSGRSSLAKASRPRAAMLTDTTPRTSRRRLGVLTCTCPPMGCPASSTIRPRTRQKPGRRSLISSKLFLAPARFAPPRTVRANHLLLRAHGSSAGDRSGFWSRASRATFGQRIEVRAAIGSGLGGEDRAPRVCLDVRSRRGLCAVIHLDPTVETSDTRSARRPRPAALIIPRRGRTARPGLPIGTSRSARRSSPRSGRRSAKPMRPSDTARIASGP